MEQLAFVMAIGIDQGKNPQNFLITYQFAQPQKGSQSGSETKEWTISTEVAHLPESMEKVYEVLNRQPFLGTTKILIIGEDIAKAGFNDALDSFQRVYQFRRTMYILVAKGSAKDILTTKLRNEQLPALSLLGRMEQYKGVSVFPVTSLGHYITVLAREGQAPILPLVEKLKPGQEGIEYEGEQKGKAEELRIQGAGVFRVGRLMDYLNDQETKGYMWLENETGTRFISADQVDGVGVTAKVISAKTSYNVNQEQDGYHFKYQIKAQAVLDEVKGKQPLMSPEEWAVFIHDVEGAVEKAIEKECQAAIQKDKTIAVDFLGIGRHIEQKKPSFWKEVRNNWEGTLPSLPVDIDVQLTLKNGGVARNSPVSPVSAIKTGQD